MKDKRLILFAVLLLLLIVNATAQNISPYLSTGHKKPITNMLFAKSGALLITTDVSGKCVVWDFFGRKEVNNITFHKADSIKIINDSILYCKSTKQYFSLPLLKPLNSETIVEHATVKHYRITSEDDGDYLKLYKDNKLQVTATKLVKKITGYSINADETLMAHICGDQYLILHPLAQPENYRQIDVGESVIKASFNPVVTQLIALGTPGGDIKVFDVNAGELIFTLSSDLLNPISIYDDLNKKNVVINESNNSYVFNYQNIALDQFSLPFNKLKPNESYVHNYDDSLKKSAFFYWQNNYTLHKYVNDTDYHVAGYRTTRADEKYITPIIDVATMIATLSIFSTRGIVNYKPPVQNVVLQSQQYNNVDYNINGKVVFNSADSKKVYHTVGQGSNIFAQDDSTILAYRKPAYLNLMSKTRSFKPVNYYLFDKNIKDLTGLTITSLNTICNSFFAMQEGGKFTLLQRRDNSLTKKQVLTGTYINASDSGSEFYYKKGDSVIIHQLLSGNESILTTRGDNRVLFIKRLVNNNTLYGYLIFYDIGIIEYKTPDDKLKGTYYCYSNGEFIFILPDNSFYSSSKTLIQKVLLKSNDDIYQLDQFEAQFNRPDVVMKQIGYVDDDKIKIYTDAYTKYLKRSPVKTEVKPGDLPQAEITNWNNTYYTSHSLDTIHCLFSASKSKLGKINVYINSVPVFGTQGIDMSSKNISVFDTTIVLHLNKGDNLVKPIVIAANGTKNFVKSYYVKADYQATPHVYFLGIGANTFLDKNHNLTYADKDITALCSALKVRYGQNLSIDTLFDKNVNNASIQASLAKLKGVDINDKVIIYYSGHGLLGKNKNYYFSGYNVNFDTPENGGILYQGIENSIDQIPSRYKIFFIDACYSGEQENGDFTMKNTNAIADGKRGTIMQMANNTDNSFYVMQDIFSDFSQGSGTVIISAARGNQSALENSKWSHGAFTYSILQGLQNNKADLNQDGKISISELKNYVSRKVSEITEGKQKPTARKDVLDYDWVF